jgi:hypothetical protein
MARYHHNVYAMSEWPKYIVPFDLQWQIVECRRLEPSADLRKEMATTIARPLSEGWEAEDAPEYGFSVGRAVRVSLPCAASASQAREPDSLPDSRRD